jgi:hypothetical protein
MNRDAHIQFVITTRDVSIVDRSKRRRFNRSEHLCRDNRNRSRQFIGSIIQKKLPHFIFSYETLVYLREDYLRHLYGFLGVQSGFLPPDLFDGNARYIVSSDPD